MSLHTLRGLALGIMVCMVPSPALAANGSAAAAAEKLRGRVIGTAESVDYRSFARSTTVNTREMAFDGDMSTYFASWERSYTWAGLDLGEPHVITRVGWSPRNDGQGPQRVVLGVFEGANREDFTDALPLYVITEQGVIGQMAYADVACSRGFRYVRYVGPADARCNVAELEFYGVPGAGCDSLLWQLTNLPTVSIHTQDGIVPYDKEHDIAATVAIVADGGATLLCDAATVRERGNGSRTFPKRPYRIKFDRKQRVLSAPAKAKKWTLINNYGDKTLMRNLLAFELSRIMQMPYTPFGTAVDVLLNGEYKGCYQLCDQVQVHKHRVDVEEMTPADTDGEALTGGYLVEVDAYAGEEPSWFRSSYGNPVTIKSPSADSITAVQAEYIEDCFDAMERDWPAYLDMNTFLRHFLVGELSGNTDTYWSLFMYKRRGCDTLFTGPVWDFDLAFENDNRTYPVCAKSDWVYRSGGSYAGNMRSFVDRIVVRDAGAQAQMRYIWGQAREGELTEGHLLACIDSLERLLEQSQRLNFMRWPILNTKVHQNPRLYGSYAAEVENVRHYVRERLPWMDARIGYTYVDGVAATAAAGSSVPLMIYNLHGLPVGTDAAVLRPGVYVRGGRKMLVH